MAEVETNTVKASEEQTLYANVLAVGMYAGLALLLLTFAVYVLGIMDPYLSFADLPKYWQMSSTDYLEAANVEQGWGWVALLGYGDFLNFLGIALLAGVTIICYLSITPLLIRNKDFIYATIALLEVFILALAASGILAAGH